MHGTTTTKIVDKCFLQRAYRVSFAGFLKIPVLDTTRIYSILPTKAALPYPSNKQTDWFPGVQSFLKM
jgi:hypothetical protein